MRGSRGGQIKTDGSYDVRIFNSFVRFLGRAPTFVEVVSPSLHVGLSPPFLLRHFIPSLSSRLKSVWGGRRVCATNERKKGGRRKEMRGRNGPIRCLAVWNEWTFPSPFSFCSSTKEIPRGHQSGKQVRFTVWNQAELIGAHSWKGSIFVCSKIVEIMQLRSEEILAVKAR